MSRAPEFIPLSDVAARAVSGANSRHAALIEDAFGVLVETPGGGVSVSGDSKSRGQAKKAVQSIAERADQGLEIGEADVRVAIGNARTGTGGPGHLPIGRRGQVAPKTATQAEYLQALAKCELVFGLGAALGVAAHRHAAAGRLDQHAEGVLDQGGVARVGAGDRAGGDIGQRDEFGRAAHKAISSAGSTCWASTPPRLIRAASSIRTGTIWPINRSGASA